MTTPTKLNGIDEELWEILALANNTLRPNVPNNVMWSSVVSEFKNNPTPKELNHHRSNPMSDTDHNNTTEIERS